MRLLQYLSLPKGKRLLCKSWMALGARGRLQLAAAGMRLLPQFVASVGSDDPHERDDAFRADADLAACLSMWIKNVVALPDPGCQTPSQSTLALLTHWLKTLVASYEAITLKALLQHNGSAEVMVALLHRGEDECARHAAPAADISAWYVPSPTARWLAGWLAGWLLLCLVPCVWCAVVSCVRVFDCCVQARSSRRARPDRVLVGVGVSLGAGCRRKQHGTRPCCMFYAHVRVMSTRSHTQTPHLSLAAGATSAGGAGLATRLTASAGSSAGAAATARRPPTCRAVVGGPRLG